MKDVGAYLVSDSAVDALIEFLEQHGADVSKKALEFTVERKAKTLSAEDIARAIKSF